jgi:hypothetical protein
VVISCSLSACDPESVGLGIVLGSAGQNGNLEDSGVQPTDSGPPLVSDAGDAGRLQDATLPPPVDECPIPDAGSGPVIPVPFVVSQYFTLDGGGANDAAQPGALVATNCDVPREPGALGDCLRFSYTPEPPPALGLSSWAYMVYKPEADNWGERPGPRVAPGATLVSFRARGVVGGELLVVSVGGVGGGNEELEPEPCRDAFFVERGILLTTEFVRYEISIEDLNYDRVVGAFAWKVSRVLFSEQLVDGGTIEPTEFYLDDIRWQ